MTYALTLFLLTVPIMVVNQKYYRVGFKTLFHLSPNMDSLIAVGSAAAVIYGIAACTASAGGWATGTWLWWSTTPWICTSSQRG